MSSERVKPILKGLVTLLQRYFKKLYVSVNEVFDVIENEFPGADKASSTSFSGTNGKYCFEKYIYLSLVVNKKTESD